MGNLRDDRSGYGRVRINAQVDRVKPDLGEYDMVLFLVVWVRANFGLMKLSWDG